MMSTDRELALAQRDGAVGRLRLLAWERPVLSAVGLTRAGRHSEYATQTVWGCVRRGPGGVKKKAQGAQASPPSPLSASPCVLADVVRDLVRRPGRGGRVPPQHEPGRNRSVEPGRGLKPVAKHSRYSIHTVSTLHGGGRKRPRGLKRTHWTPCLLLPGTNSPGR
jgi:hypothetical protein